MIPVILLALISAVHGAGFAVKFNVIHEAILECPKKGSNEIQFNLQLYKKDRSSHLYMRGNITFETVFDDTLSLKAKLLVWGNGGWKAGSGVDVAKDQGCSSFLGILGPVFKLENKKCPIQPGVWEGQDMDTEIWNKLAIPGAPLNRYKLEITFFRREGGNKNILGCYSSIFTVKAK